MPPTDSPTQDDRPIAIETPLGKDVLLLRAFKFSEDLGQPFAMDLEMQSTNWSISFREILGKKIVVTALCPSTKQKRVFCGVMAQFTQTGSHHKLANYRGQMVPWIWLLSRASNCRTFENKTVTDIIQEVFSDHGFTAVENQLGKPPSSYPAIPFCMQYNETDLNFVSRLMEQWGITYYFNSSVQGVSQSPTQTIILVDPETHPPEFPGYSTIYFNAQRVGAGPAERIYDWVIDQEVQTGIVTLDDYDYTHPNKNLQETAKAHNTEGDSGYERYFYPGGYTETGRGEDFAKLRLQELQSQHAVHSGSGNVLGMAAGYQFQLQGFNNRKDQNKSYLTTGIDMSVTTAEFSAGKSDQEKYSCVTHFRAVGVDSKFVPRCRAHKPRIQGPQTAVVVGDKDHSEVSTDSYGNVRVRFHWDSDGQNDQNTTCMARVSQPWAGSGWGAMYIPHVGSEVIVEFEEGDPDRPIITGRVYNAQSMPAKSPSENPMLGYIEDSSQKNLFQMDATDKKEKVLIQNGANKITMDSTAGSESLVITDGKSNITFDTPNGNVNTKQANDENKWTWGDWTEWVKGIKVSQVVGWAYNFYFGAYSKICIGVDLGIFLGSRIEVITGIVLKSLHGWELKHSEYGKGFKAPNMLSQVKLAIQKHFAVVTVSTDEAKKVAGLYAVSAGEMEQTVTGALTLNTGEHLENVVGSKTVNSEGPMLLMSDETITIESTMNVDLVSGFDVTINGTIVNIG